MENKLPITRLTKFFSKDDFDLHMRVGQEYLHGDINMKVVLYRVDREKTETDDVYAEVGKDQVKFFPPVELNGIVRIEEPTNATYKNGIDRYLEPGNMIFSVYINHLEELKVDIRYGDYLGYSESEEKIRFYMVTNDGKVVSDNKHSHFGFKPSYRTITCAFVQDNEFRGV